jgi:hypothetical protein
MVSTTGDITLQGVIDLDPNLEDASISFNKAGTRKW